MKQVSFSLKLCFYLAALIIISACTVPTMQLKPVAASKANQVKYSALGDIRVQRFFDARPKIQKTALKRYFKKKLPSGIFSGKTNPSLPVYLQTTMRSIGQENGSNAPYSNHHYVITGIIQSIEVLKKKGAPKELINPKIQYVPYIGASYYHASVKFKAELRQAGLILLTSPITVNLFEITASHLTIEQDSDKMAILLEKAIKQAVNKMYQSFYKQSKQKLYS
ncbi:hypothetical protein [Piscirickettsia litoralis]|uniref:ABC-type transport auxiliary lipoprotein component domain-containing protein n=1 Tax=Piscirickettsia litoralis TaxID=1891921 RepID=A0ABX3A2P0_9GAMM|nr:hypothetical protein [Piscirickettsia litoralis]ODN41903.1 hypothetical protein BGC07_01650 [Piscirickettsia litoralis]